jgi:CRP-like cAMP-binding protein
MSDVWSQIEAISFLKQYPAGEPLFREGARPDEVVAICAGRVRLSSLGQDGNIPLVWVACAGDLIGFSAVLSNRPYALSAETLGPCELRIVKRDAFLVWLDANPDLWKKIAVEQAERHYNLIAQMKINPLIRFLQMVIGLCDTSKTAIPRIGLTIQSLADSIGVVDRTVYRYVSALKDMGLVTRDDNRWIRVIDLPGLKAYLKDIQSGHRRLHRTNGTGPKKS